MLDVVAPVVDHPVPPVTVPPLGFKVTTMLERGVHWAVSVMVMPVLVFRALLLSVNGAIAPAGRTVVLALPALCAVTSQPAKPLYPDGTVILPIPGSVIFVLKVALFGVVGAVPPPTPRLYVIALIVCAV